MLDADHAEQNSEFWYMGEIEFKDPSQVRDMSVTNFAVYYASAYYRSRKAAGAVFPVATWRRGASSFGYKPGLVAERLRPEDFTRAKQLIHLSTRIAAFSDYHRFQAIYWNCNSFVQFFSMLVFPQETGLWYHGNKWRTAPFGKAEAGMSHYLVSTLASVNSYKPNMGLDLPEGIDKHMREDWMTDAVRAQRAWMSGQPLPHG